MSLILDSKLRLLLMDGKIEEFNRLTEDEPADLASTDLRMADLRGANLRHASLRGAYLRNADLRGVNLLYADLDGASIHRARISGALFPRDIPPPEILLSLHEGTRLRAERVPPPGDPDVCAVQEEKTSEGGGETAGKGEGPDAPAKPKPGE